MAVTAVHLPPSVGLGARRRRTILRRRRRQVAVIIAVVFGASLAAALLVSPPTRVVTELVVPADATRAALADIPADWLARYQTAARDCAGLPWEVLAAIGSIETGHGANRRTSSAGAVGPMQFLPSTWAAYGVDADGSGRADIRNADDAVHTAARFLCASGGGYPRTLRKALWNYNHADWYVDAVLALAGRYGAAPATLR